MKVKEKCYRCKNFIPSRMIGSGEGEWVYPECSLGYSVSAKDNQECNHEEPDDFEKRFSEWAFDKDFYDKPKKNTNSIKLTEQQLRKIIRESLEELVGKWPDEDDHEVTSDNFDYETGKFKYGVRDMPTDGIIGKGGKRWNLRTRKGQEDYMWDNLSTDGMRKNDENSIIHYFGNKNVGGINWPSEGDSYLNDYDFLEPGSLGMAAQGDENRDPEAYWAQDKKWASPKGDFRTRR